MSSSLRQTFTADDKELMKAYQRIMQENAKLLEANQRLSTTTTQGFHDAKQSATDYFKKVASGTAASVLGFHNVEGAVLKVVDALRQAIKMQNDLDEKMDQASLTVGDAEARFLNQARGSGLPKEQLEKIVKDVEQRGAQFGMKPAEAAALATEEVSQGVSAENVGEIFNVANKWAGAQGKPLTMDLLRPFLQAVRIEDEKFSPQAAEHVAKDFFGLFLSRQLQPQHLEPFSRVNRALQQAGMSDEERTALNVASLDLYGGSAEQAATFDRAWVSHVRAPTEEGKKALTTMGLAPADVDFVGENLQTVLERLGQGLQRLKPEDQVPALVKLVGQEFGGQLRALIDQRGKIGDLLKEEREGATKFDEAAKDLYSTPGARVRRSQAEVELEDTKRGQPDVEVGRAALDAAMAKAGADAISRFMARFNYGVMTFIERHTTGDVTAEEAIGYAQESAKLFGTGFGGPSTKQLNRWVEEGFAPADIEATAPGQSPPQRSAAPPIQPAPPATRTDDWSEDLAKRLRTEARKRGLDTVDVDLRRDVVNFLTSQGVAAPKEFKAQEQLLEKNPALGQKFLDFEWHKTHPAAGDQAAAGGPPGELVHLIREQNALLRQQIALQRSQLAQADGHHDERLAADDRRGGNFARGMRQSAAAATAAMHRGRELA